MTSTTRNLTAGAPCFHALSDPTRLRIVELLRHGERCVCDLTDALEAAQSRLSFHLKVLREAGLVADRREGRWVYYRLRSETFDRMASLLQEHGSLAPHSGSGLEPCCDSTTHQPYVGYRED